MSSMGSTPNLFLIGTQKGGSTSLFMQLEQHPDIATLGEKEPNIFDVPSESAAQSRLHKLGPDSENFRFLMDGSVNYSRYPKFESVPSHIHAICKNADLRFVYLLRHPVERLISNYFWSAAHFGETRSLEEALEQDPQYIQTGLYAQQLKQYLQHFHLGQFHFVKFDDYVRNPVQETLRIFDWLGLSPIEIEVAGKTHTATNKKVTRKARLPFINRLIWSSAKLRAVINRCVPQSLIRKCSRILTRPEERPVIGQATKRALLERFYLADIQEVALQTGLDLQDWLEAYSRESEANADNP